MYYYCTYIIELQDLERKYVCTLIFIPITTMTNEKVNDNTTNKNKRIKQNYYLANRMDLSANFRSPTKSQLPSFVYILILKPRTSRIVSGEPRSCTTVEKRAVSSVSLPTCGIRLV